jgi:hypothetical protein
VGGIRAALKAQWVLLTVGAGVGFAAAAAGDSHPRSDTFQTKPSAASATGKSACGTAQIYVERINAGHYDQLSDLFAPDAVFLTPTGQVLTGRDQIGQFYRKLLGSLRPAIVPISFISDGRDCVMELAAATQADNSTQYRLSAIDHFTMNKAGQIVHMIVYLRPQAMMQVK